MTAAALIESHTGRLVSSEQLNELISQYINFYTEHNKQLVLIITENLIDIVAALRGSLQAGHAVLLCDPTVAPETLLKLITIYQPKHCIIPSVSDQAYATVLAELDFSLSRQDIGRDIKIFSNPSLSDALHSDLAILLMTSGSTGSPKLVRLSHENIEINTKDIIEALSINPADRVAAHMPLAYSYGLSVVTAHLAAGATTVLLRDSMTTSSFWQALRTHKVTTLPGVPYHFELMRRLGIERLNVPTLHTMTQAGGRLDPETIRYFAETMRRRKGKFYVMYGQTEASPRMTTLPDGNVLDKVGSVGLAMAHGRIMIEDDEIIYHGPNVMMGYAECRADLARGDEMRGRLSTGDLGYLDNEGFLYITGRKNRFAKIDGLRINLDDVDALAAIIAPTVAVEDKNQLILFTTGDAERVRREVLAHVHLHPTRVLCRPIKELPRLVNGKVDVQALRDMLHDS